MGGALTPDLLRTLREMANVNSSTKRLQAGVVHVETICTPADNINDHTSFGEPRDCTYHFTVCLSPTFHTSPLLGTTTGGGLFCATAKANNATKAT